MRVKPGRSLENRFPPGSEFVDSRIRSEEIRKPLASVAIRVIELAEPPNHVPPALQAPA